MNSAKPLCVKDCDKSMYFVSLYWVYFMLHIVFPILMSRTLRTSPHEEKRLLNGIIVLLLIPCQTINVYNDQFGILTIEYFWPCRMFLENVLPEIIMERKKRPMQI